MALSPKGLTVQTFEEVLQSIITSEQENVSSQIDVSDDTALGQTNKIMAQEIASLNELLQDIYDQRNILTAEGKALDDIVSWLGVTRQGQTATSGEQYFVGNDATIVPQGSFVQNSSTLENYTLDAAVTITRDSCRECTIGVLVVDDSSYNYTVSVDGVFSTYTSQSGDNESAIVSGIVSAISVDTDGSYQAVNNNDGTFTISVTETVNPEDIAVTIDPNLLVDSVISAGNITGVNTGPLPATANSVITILSPTNGWQATYNPNALIIGRNEETDAELRARAIEFRSSSGKATVDSIKAALLDVIGVSSVAVNERYVSEFSGNFVIEPSAADNTTYTIEINEKSFTINSGAGASQASISAAMVSEINSSLDRIDYIGVDNTDGTYSIATDKLYTISVSDPVGNQQITEGQPAGSIQVVVAGGADNNEIAQVIWDTKPAGVEVWALEGANFNEGTAVDAYGEQRIVEFNRPTSIAATVNITYKVFDESVYPENDQDAYDAIKLAVETFGNALGAGEAVKPSEFEGTVYNTVGGIYTVQIDITTQNGSASSSIPEDEIFIATDEEAFFDANLITVTNQT